MQVPNICCALEKTQVFFKPLGVIKANGLDQPVVRQFIPGCATAFLGADKIGFFEYFDNVIGQPVTLFRRPEYLAANTLWAD